MTTLPLGAAGQCIEPIALPGMTEIGLPYIRCWNALPCASHPPTEHPKHRKDTR